METQRILMRSLAVVFIASVIWTITVSAHPVAKVSTCCTVVSTAELTDPITGFRMQKNVIPPCVKAVIFQTERGEFCCDWTRPWVQKKVMQFCFNRAQRNKHRSSTPSPSSSITISEHTRVGGSTQSSTLMNHKHKISAHPVQKVNTCCTVVSTAEFTDPITGFRMQKQDLPCVRAIILKTERGEFCIDWTQPWVKEKMNQFFRAQRNKHLISPPPPASSIISAHPVEKVYTCCKAVSTAELTDPIIGFRMQKQSLPCVKAVIFQTEGGEFCCDWTQPWVQKKVKQFFRAQRNKP